MKKGLVLLLSASIALSLCACGNTEPENATTEFPVNQSTEMTGVANPWTDCETLEEAEKLAGFTYNFPETLPDGSTATAYRVAEGDMIDVIYGDKLTIRQSVGEGRDDSGDYTEYSHDWEEDLSGISCNLKGTKDVVYLTIFSYEGFSYVIYNNDQTLTYDEIADILTTLSGQDADSGEDGAPTVDEDRMIADEAILPADIAGRYDGESYDCDISIYDDMEEYQAEVGNIVISDASGNEVYSSELMEVMDNFYELNGKDDVNITVYKDGDNICLDLYIDGEHVDYLTMTDHYES